MEVIIYLFIFFAVFGLGAYAAHTYHVEQREKEQQRIIEELNKANGIVEDVTWQIQSVLPSFGSTVIGEIKSPLTPQFNVPDGAPKSDYERMLKQALDEEDYEEAARIRDLMNRK